MIRSPRSPFCIHVPPPENNTPVVTGQEALVSVCTVFQARLCTPPGSGVEGCGLPEENPAIETAKPPVWFRTLVPPLK